MNVANARTCDFCGGAAITEDEDAWGLVKCDACRTRETMEGIEDVIARADGVVVGWQVDNVRNELSRSKELFHHGDLPVAKESLRSARHLANSLYNALESAPDILNGRAAQKQRSDAGFTSGAERAAERQPIWDEWQREATRIRRENLCLSKSEVFRRTGKKFKVSRQSVSKHVTLPDK